MKKLLSLFAAIVVLSGCSSLGGMFGGAECDSKLARDFMANAEDRVFFAFDSSAITDNSAEILQTQVKWLKKHNEVNVIVQGYCDERGTREYNWLPAFEKSQPLAITKVHQELANVQLQADRLWAEAKKLYAMYHILI